MNAARDGNLHVVRPQNVKSVPLFEPGKRGVGGRRHARKGVQDDEGLMCFYKARVRL